MKGRFMYVALVLFLLSSNHVLAQSQGHESGGGGGDMSETRVDDIRADILKWIDEGGAKSLKLPDGLDLKDYESKMKRILTRQAVVVTFVTSKEEEATNDPELKVEVANKKKTCRGFFAEKDGKPNILCNIERFSATNEADQYPLVHHEFAGLLGIEKNLGAASDYVISGQLSGYLRTTTVLKLAVRDPIFNYNPNACSLNFPRPRNRAFRSTTISTRSYAKILDILEKKGYRVYDGKEDAEYKLSIRDSAGFGCGTGITFKHYWAGVPGDFSFRFKGKNVDLSRGEELKTRLGFFLNSKVKKKIMKAVREIPSCPRSY